MSFINTHPQQRPERGFSLVEIMIAVVVGMLGILIIMQVFLVAEGQKRTTTGGADAQENALMALYTMERDLRMSGLGVTGLDCTTVNAYNANATPATYNFNAGPVTITQNSPAAGSDRVAAVYSSSAYGGIPTTITSAMPPSSSELNATNGDGFTVGDLFILSEPGKPCTLAQATQVQLVAKKIQINPSSPYNQASGGIFPQPDGYGTGSKLINMGSMVNREYYVESNNLMMRDVNLPSSATNPLPLVSGIIAIKAQYGRDTNADGYVDVYDNTAPASAAALVAIRLAVVARSGQLEKDPVAGPCDPVVPPTDLVSSCNLVLRNGGTTANGGAITLNAADRKYRYKVYQTIIPLRNVIWNN